MRLFKQKDDIVPIAGGKRLKCVENLAALEVELGAEDLKTLKQLANEVNADLAGDACAI